MNILITNRSIMYNRGSEAVIRSITQICRFWKPDSFITVSSGDEGEVLKEVFDADQTIPRVDATGGISRLLSAAREADVVLVTGADNYDYSTSNTEMESINTKLFETTKGRVILYDCSLNRNNFSDETYADIRRFSHITVRESVTYNLFKERFAQDKLSLYPDPAFVMPMEKCVLPDGFEQGKMIGINISNLIIGKRYGLNADKILLSYHNLMEYILEKTDYKILLVQHILNNGFDLEALRKIYEPFKKEKRVLLMNTELLNAMQIKYVISRLNFLVTARTHASIAAYSMCVPALVVSYSVKSIGIAKDLFGDSNPYVIPLNEMIDGTELQRKFKYIMEHEVEIRNHLNRIIPEYKLQALKFGEIL